MLLWSVRTWTCDDGSESNKAKVSYELVGLKDSESNGLLIDLQVR